MLTRPLQLERTLRMAKACQWKAKVCQWTTRHVLTMHPSPHSRFRNPEDNHGGKRHCVPKTPYVMV